MANCVTCGRELHPERAEKYDYCTDPKCQERNAKGLTILALGVNKAADYYQVLDERTRDRVASGDWVEEAGRGKATSAGTRGRARPSATRATSGDDPRRGLGARRPWTQAQQDLALIYNQRGVRPDEIAAKLGLSTYTVTQMILAGRNRAKP